MPILKLPEVLLYSDLLPTDVLKLPVVVLLKVHEPIAVL